MKYTCKCDGFFSSPNVGVSISFLRCLSRLMKGGLHHAPCTPQPTQCPLFYSFSESRHFTSLVCFGHSAPAERQRRSGHGAVHGGPLPCSADIKASLEITRTIFCLYLTRRTFRIDMPVNGKTAPSWNLVEARLLLQPADDQHNESGIRKNLMMMAMASTAVSEQRLIKKQADGGWGRR